MTRNEFLDLIIDIIEADDDIEEDSVLEEIEDWDSLAVISVLALFNKYFAFRPDLDALNCCVTIKNILDLADGKYN